MHVPHSRPSRRYLPWAAAALALTSCSLVTASSVGQARRAAPQPTPALGINLSGPADWNTELPFVDVFRLSRPWVSQREGAGWGKGPALALDEHGWVKNLEAGCWAETPLCTIEDGHYPSGEYTVFYEGEGKVEVWGGGATLISSAAGRIVVAIDASKGGFFLRLRETDPRNPVRNIRVVMPGFAESYQDNPWHPKFLERWRGMICLRFMDFQDTNNSEQRAWAGRPTMKAATFARRGVPIELLVDLANRLNAAPWFCIPHQADDDYVRRFAELVKARLSPELPIYLEYSNEVWNGQFQQHRHAGEVGRRLGLADKPWEAAWRYTARRSVEIFDIWEQVFGGTKRLVRVLSSQAANADVSRQIVSFENAWQHADALGIAPYVSLNVPVDGGALQAADVASWSLGRLLDHVETKSLPDSIGWIKEQKQVADEYGLKLVAYEAGQHLVGVGGGENNEKLTELLHAANRHPRMGHLYRRYLAAWQAGGGDLLCHFSSVGRWSKWGSWGLLEYYDDNPDMSPKFTATMEWAQGLGQNVPPR